MIEEENKLIDEAMTKFVKARLQLIEREKFLSLLALSTTPIPTSKIERIAIDIKGNIYFNPEWFVKLPLSQAITAEAHEIGHLITDSFERGKDKDPKIWNIAADQPWNELLLNSHYEPIREEFGGWVCEKRFFGFTAEEVYYQLIKENPSMNTFDEILYVDENGNVKTQDGKTVGQITDENGNPICGDIAQKQFSEYWKEKVKEAETFAKYEGKLSAGMERIIDEVFKPRWSARAILERYITTDLAQENWKYADKKRSGKVIFPAEREEELVVGFAVDTSGSMSEKEMAICKGAISNIFSVCENVRVEVVECDANTQDIYEINRNNLTHFLAKKSFKGGGGTDYRPVIEFFNKKHPKVLLYATDLCCSDYGHPKGYEVLWLKVGNERYDKPPYGKVIPLRT